MSVAGSESRALLVGGVLAVAEFWPRWGGVGREDHARGRCGGWPIAGRVVGTGVFRSANGRLSRVFPGRRTPRTDSAGGEF